MQSWQDSQPQLSLLTGQSASVSLLDRTVSPSVTAWQDSQSQCYCWQDSQPQCHWWQDSQPQCHCLTGQSVPVLLLTGQSVPVSLLTTARVLPLNSDIRRLHIWNSLMKVEQVCILCWLFQLINSHFSFIRCSFFFVLVIFIVISITCCLNVPGLYWCFRHTDCDINQLASISLCFCLTS